jgi:osmoprotectant transport system substrate-binding protein
MRLPSLRAIVAALLLAVASFTAAAQPVVRVGSKNFTEQFVLAELYAQALEAAGIKVERKLNLGRHAHRAQGARGKADRPVSRVHGHDPARGAEAGDADRSQGGVRGGEGTPSAKQGLVVLNQAPVNNTYVMVVRPDTAQKYNLNTLSDLARVREGAEARRGPEFRDRKDGIPGLKAKYDMEFKEDLQLAIGCAIRRSRTTRSRS